MTVAFGLDTTDAVLVVSTALIFMVPVVVASLNFGMPGGLAAAVWVAVLDIPRIVDAARHDRMPALWSEVLQLAVLLTLSLLIGRRVTAKVLSAAGSDDAAASGNSSFAVGDPTASRRASDASPRARRAEPVPA